MPRTAKVTPLRPTPRPSTRSQQPSPGPQRSKGLLNILKQQQSNPAGNRGDTSDNDNESICSSSKSSDVILARSMVKGRGKDEPGAIKAPWRHPDELDYFRPYDWLEDKIISQLRGTVFTVPPPVNGKQSFIGITLYDGGEFDRPKPIKVPRGYRVPLMFVAKFQWASLKLVLTSAQREKEWSDYKFDILHLSRLCERFFAEAQKACNISIVEIPPMKARAPEFQVADGAMSRKWRCPTFDRALARYNKNWLISREEFLRDFYIEFESEEYEKDVLKIDWSRWALRGHKGFKLTQDELKNGIDARMVTRGLKKDDSGKWIWVDDYVIKQEEVAAAVVPPITEEVVTVPLPADAETTASDPQQDAEPNTHLDGQPSPAPELPSTPSPAPIDEKLAATPTQTPSTKPSRQSSSEALSVHTAKQPSPFVEKFHSPLSSLPSSASPSEAPVSHIDTTTAANTVQTNAQKSPTPKSPSPGAAVRSPKILSPAPLTTPTPAPQAILPSTPASEGTQPPGSHSPPPVSSPERRVETIHNTPSPLTPVHPDTFFSSPHQESILKPELEEVKPIIIPDRRLTPTSIDSTPNPSPAISPKDTEKLAEPVEVIPEIPTVTSTEPNTADSQIPSVSGSEGSNLPFPGDSTLRPEPSAEDDKTAVPAAEVSPPSTPYGPPRPPLPMAEEAHVSDPGSKYDSNSTPLENNVKDTPRVSQLSKTPAPRQSPAFQSPLLPPENPSRSPSLDEIPGLGGLPSRQPLCLPPHFVAPKMTARTVTAESSWLVMESDSANQIRGLKIEPQEPDLSLMDDVHMQSDVEVTSTSRDTPMQSPERTGESPEIPEQVMAADIDSSPVASPQASSLPRLTYPSTPPMVQKRNQSKTPTSEGDDDSDMDFGTPVTSPVIIVPGPKLESIEMLPPARETSPHSTHDYTEDTPRISKGPSPLPITPKPALSGATASDGAHNITETQGLQSASPTKTTPEPTNVLPVGLQESLINTEKSAGISTEGSPSIATPVSTQRPPNDDSQPFTTPQTPSPVYQTHPFLPSFSSSAPAASSASSQDRPPPLFNAQQSQLSNTDGHTFVQPPLALPRRPIVASPSVRPHLNGSITSTFQQQKSFDRPINILVHPQIGRPDLIPEGGPSCFRPLPLQSQPTILDGIITQVPAESTPRRDQRSDLTSPTGSFSSAQEDSSMREMVLSQSMVVSRKRQREDEDDEDEDENEDEDGAALKSRKRGEGLSIREGGIVVRKVVSMVRDTLTGLNDLLEIAAENELIPSEKLRGRSKGKAKAPETPASQSPLYTPVPPSPVVQTPTRSHAAYTSDITRLSEELKSMRTEMVQLKEKNLTSETFIENEHVRTMRAELAALREQVRILKEAKTSPERPEVQVMKNELVSLRNEMRSLQDISRQPFIPSVPSTPLTPNLTLRFNNHTMANTVHPLAHLLAVEHDPTPPTPTATVPSTQLANAQMDSNTILSGPSHPSSGEKIEKQPSSPVSTPHPPVTFDDISVPVKSKRKARIIFSRS